MFREYQFPFETEPVIKLGEIENILRKQKIIRPIPERQTFIKWIQDGTLDGKKTSKGYYLVTVESFNNLVKSWQVEVI